MDIFNRITNILQIKIDYGIMFEGAPTWKETHTDCN